MVEKISRQVRIKLVLPDQKITELRELLHYTMSKEIKESAHPHSNISMILPLQNNNLGILVNVHAKKLRLSGDKLIQIGRRL